MPKRERKTERERGIVTMLFIHALYALFDYTKLTSSHGYAARSDPDTDWHSHSHSHSHCDSEPYSDTDHVSQLPDWGLFNARAKLETLLV